MQTINGNIQYFDLTTGEQVKGQTLTIDGVIYSFDKDSGNGTQNIISDDSDNNKTKIVQLDNSITNNLNSKNTVITKNTDGTSTTNITYANLKDATNNISNLDPDTSVPYFNADAIKNIPAATTKDAKTGQVESLDVWDSWALQDAKTGKVADYHGYTVVFALAGVGTIWNDQQIYMFYTKYGDMSLNHWKNAGPVFGFNEEGENLQRWSGSATINDDDSIQLFYTQVTQPMYAQKLATVNLSMSYNNDELNVVNLNNNHILFEGDGYHYQTYEQWYTGGNYEKRDNLTLRDPHVIDVNGERYVVFESNTGNENYQSDTAVNNPIYYGGTDDFNRQSIVNTISNEDKLKLSQAANAAIGLIKLSDNQNNPIVAEISSPLIAGNAIIDEIERPNIIPLKNKYYLFTDTRLNNSVVSMSNPGINVAMLGYVSDSLKGPYEPLNVSGTVLTGTQVQSSRTDTYSYYAVPISGYDDLLLITSYMSNRNAQAGYSLDSTFAPSFLIQIGDDGKTTRVLDTILSQGAWTYDDEGKIISLTGNKQTAELKGKIYGWFNNQFYINDELVNGYQYDYLDATNYLFKDGIRQSRLQFYDNSYYYFDPITYKRLENKLYQVDLGKTYYFGNDGRAQQGLFAVDGVAYNFGTDNTYYKRGYATGYLLDVVTDQWAWYENGQKYTGFRHYMGAYYYFKDGVRQENSFETAWGNTYYVGNDGRTVQGEQVIDGQLYDFGTNGTFNLKSRPSGYLNKDNGWKWYENGQKYTGFRYYMGVYYYFKDGVRQENSFETVWGKTYYVGSDGRIVQGIQTINGKQYYFGNDNTFYLRTNTIQKEGNQTFKSNDNGVLEPWIGYIYDGSADNGGYRWYENGQLFTGFRYYMGYYYWFEKGVRSGAGWHGVGGYMYYTDQNGHAVQGIQHIPDVDGIYHGNGYYDFGNDGTYYLRSAN
ncbi:glycoside hydrolase family 68 protein [Leuconostoc suionicum]|uniref:glycoside hydrolase family 68 protein n=1 Tax=Leuconostoc suionicum TaxID=1511761 RepID=UPI0021AAECD3|nr:glycoside hydrolase family 68 protein [Leuconostoc suionicum]